LDWVFSEEQGVKELVALAVQISLLLIVLSIGLQARWSDLTCAFKYPRRRAAS